MADAAPGRTEPGTPRPLGATCSFDGVNFALFSRHAEAVEVCLFDVTGEREVARAPLPEHTDGVWHGHLPGLRPGQRYGYRVYGPYAPEEGHRFNHHKLLVDPYARALHGPLRWNDALFGHRVGDELEDLSFDDRDSAPFVPKSVVVGPAGSTTGKRPDTPWSETVIYEGHVRGLTMRHPGLPDAHRGTFAGVAAPALVEHMRALGVTALQLLPVHAFITEPFLASRGRQNYWGYNTLAFFAPHAPYLGSDTRGAFASMVASLHDAGIEVFLDVVYNHTAEGDHLGPTLSLRGIDNASYYRLDPENRRHYLNVTGTGNTLDVSEPAALRLVMDSLRYWAGDMGVDGFRFDLASVLGREENGFDPRGGFFDAVGQDPVLGARKTVAEPWDVGEGGYQLGRFPPGWSEWNDRFRDATRRFWRGDPGTLAEFASRMAGSSDLFEHDGRRPWASVNFVTAHDGFTLRDVVSYAERHNDANGEDSQDGHEANFSANYGVEGPTDDPEISSLRQRQQRNFLACLFLAQGAPMLLAGDELGHSQGGNNNAYSQDNEVTWLDWDGADAALTEFVSELTAARRRHPALRGPRFLHRFSGLSWAAPSGEPMAPTDWHNDDAPAVTMLLAPEGAGESLAIVVSAANEPLAFRLPDLPGAWSLVLSTGDGQLQDDGRGWLAPPKSLALLRSPERAG